MDAIAAHWRYDRNVTLVELRILNRIALGCIERRQWTCSALASDLGVPAPTVCKHVKKYREAGLIEESVHPDDRRVRLLCITEEGKGFINEWAKDIPLK